MKYKAIFTKQAEADLRGIYEYIAFSLYELNIAAKQVNHIENTILKLNDMPERVLLIKKELVMQLLPLLGFKLQ